MLDEPIAVSLEALSDYGIDADLGFLPGKEPLRELPGTFAPWEDVARDLPKLLVAGRLRRVVETLPTLDGATLVGDRALRRAMMLLSYLGHAYVWAGSGGAERIPESIAAPWFHVADRLGRPPVLSYASYALDNWRRLDPTGPVVLDNVAILQNFLGGADEDWFILIHVDIEAKAGRAIRAIPQAVAAAERNDPPGLECALGEIDAGIAAMIETLRRMPEFCDPYIYYHRVRPYIHGWKNNPAVPDGVVYEGVEAFGGRPQTFRGETGAQSGIVPAIDAALGVAHQNDELRVYLAEMRDYMPPGHRAFLEAVERRARVRDFVRSAGTPSLTAAYDACLEGIRAFRAIHLEYAATYIFQQAQSAATNPNSVGTGGTPFMPYLKKHRDETSAAKIAGG